MTTEVFRLYGNCVPVRGARRSLLCDLQKGRAHFIPNGLYGILTELGHLSVEEIKDSFERECDAVIDGYMEFLVREDYGFFTDEPEKFPPVPLEWDRPEAVTNAIIDADRDSAHDYGAILDQLDELGCQALQLRCHDALSREELFQLLQATGGRRLRHLDLILAYTPELDLECLGELCLQHQWVYRILLHSSPFDDTRRLEPLGTYVVFQSAKFDADHCGQVEVGYFSVNLQHFSEAQHFNTCLNRKLSITADGEIKNCPSMLRSLGNVRTTALADAVRHPSLVQLGRITKDQVEVCRECEFRYICTDCRVYTRDFRHPYAKPRRCGYDPRTATWTETGDV